MNLSASEKMQGNDRGKKQGKDVKKQKQLKKKRLIVRNLSFKISEEMLKNIFSEYGEVLEVSLPVMNDGRKRGFAFIQYADMKSVIKAMKALNFKKIYDRPIAIDYAVSKTKYHEKFQKSESVELDNYSGAKNVDESESSEDESIKRDEEITPESSEEMQSDKEEMTDDDKKVKTFFKKFDADESADIDENSVDENSSDTEESSDELDLKTNDKTVDKHESKNLQAKHPNVKRSQDVSEGKTIFFRNVSFNASEEDLHEILQKYGELEYCLICMDKLTDHSKGTAFAKFKEKEKADKFIEEASKDPGIFLDRRRLLCSLALSREELGQKENNFKKPKDKRNLRLLKCGIILPDSEEAKDVSRTDMAKRAQLQLVKKKKLNNVNFFVSDNRLAIHNLPKNFTDKELRILFKNAVGREAIITEARVMRDFKKTDAQGIPVSRGFGFVSFTKHEHALKALVELNNNPKIFAPQKRPIVEFSIENKVALLTQERRREKMIMRNKKKMEEKEEHNSYQTYPYSQKNTVHRNDNSHKNKRKKFKNNRSLMDNNNDESKEIQGKNNEVKKQNKRKKFKNKKSLTDNNNDESKQIQGKTNEDKKQKRDKSQERKKRKIAFSEEDKKSISSSINKYKEKLFNKIS